MRLPLIRISLIYRPRMLLQTPLISSENERVLVLQVFRVVTGLLFSNRGGGSSRQWLVHFHCTSMVLWTVSTVVHLVLLYFLKRKEKEIPVSYIGHGLITTIHIRHRTVSYWYKIRSSPMIIIAVSERKLKLRSVPDFSSSFTGIHFLLVGVRRGREFLRVVMDVLFLTPSLCQGEEWIIPGIYHTCNDRVPDEWTDGDWLCMVVMMCMNPLNSFWA